MSIFFNKNFTRLLASNVLSQFIIILSLPFLGRIYDPQSFGILAGVMSVASICVPIIHGRYHMAILVARASNEKLALFIIAIILTLLLSIPLVLSGVLIFGIKWEGSSDIYVFASCIFATIILSLLDVSSYWLGYRNRFSVVSFATKLKALVTVASQIFFGVVTGYGVLLGSLVGIGVSFIYVMLNVLKHDVDYLRIPAFWELSNALKTYSHFPVYGVPQGLLAAMSWNLLPLLLLKFGGALIAGNYWVAYRVLISPLLLFNSSYRQVVFTEFGQLDFQTSLAVVKKHTSALALLGVMGVIFFGYFGVPLFELVMGDVWLEAGKIAQILSLSIASDLFKVPSICLMQSMNRQRELLFWEFGISAFRYIGIVILLFDGKLDQVILTFSLLGLIGWTIFTISQIFLIMPRSLKNDI